MTFSNHILVSENGKFWTKLEKHFGESDYIKVYKSMESKGGKFSKYNFIKMDGVVAKVK